MLRSNTSRGYGFTIVELLIVIVVIGILAAITVVAFNGIQNNAKRASTLSDLRSWSKLLELYKAQHGTSAIANGEYCLGTGFPTGYCRNSNGPSATSYAESTGASIITELSKVGKVPDNPKYIYSGYVGPYLVVYSGSMSLRTFIPANDDQECGRQGLIHAWLNGAATVALCQIDTTR